MFFILFVNCSMNNEINYKKFNERFDFSDRKLLIKSINDHFIKFNNYTALNTFKDTQFTIDCENSYTNILSKNYEKYIESNPQVFFCFIEYLNESSNYEQKDKLYFYSSQAFLRAFNQLNF